MLTALSRTNIMNLIKLVKRFIKNDKGERLWQD